MPNSSNTVIGHVVDVQGNLRMATLVHGDRRLEEISNAALISIGKLLSGEENFMTEKFHPYLSLDLLLEDAPSSRIDLGALPELARSMIGGNE